MKLQTRNGLIDSEIRLSYRNEYELGIKSFRTKISKWWSLSFLGGNLFVYTTHEWRLAFAFRETQLTPPCNLANQMLNSIMIFLVSFRIQDGNSQLREKKNDQISYLMRQNTIMERMHIPVRTACFAVLTTGPDIAAIRSASLIAAVKVSFAGNTLFTTPIWWNSVPVAESPVRTNSIACVLSVNVPTKCQYSWLTLCLPSARANRCVPPAPGMVPILISGRPNVELSAA